MTAHNVAVTDNEKILLTSLYASHFAEGSGRLVLRDWAFRQGLDPDTMLEVAKGLATAGIVRPFMNGMRYGLSPKGVAVIEEQCLADPDSIRIQREFRRHIESIWDKLRTTFGEDATIVITGILRENRIDESQFERNYFLLNLPGPSVW